MIRVFLVNFEAKPKNDFWDFSGGNTMILDGHRLEQMMIILMESLANEWNKLNKYMLIK